MIAEELINDMIPPLKLKDDANKALVWMEELRCNELPVVDREKFLGFVTEDLIMEENDPGRLIADFEKLGERCFVSKNSHFYDVLKIAAEHDMQMVGVGDDEDRYLGVITVRDTINSFAQTAAIQIPGSILVLAVNQIDYSLSQISRLVEENNAKILSSSIKEENDDPTKLRITLKINKPDLSAIVATFERFGFKVIGRFQESEVLDEEKDRIDMLLKFLDI